MKHIINKISKAVQVVLLAPIKLPGKALNILKYVAIGLGIIESVLDNGKQEAEIRDSASDIRDQEKDVAGIATLDVAEKGADRAEMSAEDNHLIGKEVGDE
ncbi:hypothetical protein [Sphingobacterium lumbrici]|uniref:hypothetical protein n=1 Tax=Sphingobacterium lumbrici TaxID=2559600 RepID=UPI00112D8D7C|nr:hypothetical protein [Sphingobacterium lumbrici]